MRTEQDAIKIGIGLMDWYKEYGATAMGDEYQQYKGKLEIICWMLHINPRNPEVLRAMQ